MEGIELGVEAVVIGNATVDETYAVDALPRPGESLVGERLGTDLGGKGANVAVVLARCGLRTRLVATVGDDARADFVRTRLSGESVECALVTSATHPTDLSIVYATPDGENAIVSTVEATRSLALERAVAAFEYAAPGAPVVLQGNLPEETTLGIAAAARERGLSVVLNPSPFAPWLAHALALADAVFVNGGEARALTGSDAEAAVSALRRAGPRHAVLTRGPAGALLGRPDRSAAEAIESVPAAPATPLDTTGAGDTFLAAALASARRRDTGLDARALRHAAAAAAITVARRGTLAAFPTTHDLEQILDGS